MFNFHSTASLIFGNETAVNSTDQIVNLLGKKIFVITDERLTEFLQILLLVIDVI